MLHNWNVSEPVLCSKLNKASQPSLFSFILMKTKTWGYTCQEYSAAYLSISSYLQLASNLDSAGMISNTSSITIRTSERLEANSDFTPQTRRLLILASLHSTRICWRPGGSALTTCCCSSFIDVELEERAQWVKVIPRVHENLSLISNIHVTSEGWWGTFVIQPKLSQEHAWDSLAAEPSLLSELHPVEGETLPQKLKKNLMVPEGWILKFLWCPHV